MTRGKSVLPPGVSWVIASVFLDPWTEQDPESHLILSPHARVPSVSSEPAGHQHPLDPVQRRGTRSPEMHSIFRKLYLLESALLSKKIHNLQVFFPWTVKCWGPSLREHLAFKFPLPRWETRPCLSTVLCSGQAAFGPCFSQNCETSQWIKLPQIPSSKWAPQGARPL